jgi:glycosyltransferase involved in cell wall biosynthesis
MTSLRSILDQSTLPERVIIMAETANSWLETDIETAGLGARASQLVEIHRIPLARLGAVRNAGIRLARTPWVAFLDGDDEWRRDRLAAQLYVASQTPKVEFVAGDYVFINADGKPFAFSNGSTPTPSAWLVRRDLMLEVPFDPVAPLGEDYLWLKATIERQSRVRVPRVLVGYRIRGLSISSLHYGHSVQRRRREAMARASRYAIVRYPMIAATFVRYWLNRRATYQV